MPEPRSCVVPVINYEPPITGSYPAAEASARRSSRQTKPQPAPATQADTTQQRAAAAFADAALRRVLEVLDRRRPLAQLRPLLAAGLVESLMAGAGRNSTLGAAQLRRVRVQLVGGGATAAEVAASYARGSRVFAIACCIEEVRTATGPRWQVVALHLG